MSRAIESFLNRASESDHIPEFPVPLEHRGPDTVEVFRDHGTLYAAEFGNADDRYIEYRGPTVAVFQ